MAQSDARFGYKANLNREVFELGEPLGFTAAPGQLLPVFADIATPKDTYYINHDLEYLRTLPLTAPAMVDVKVHLESFFVPFQMIYQPIEETLFSLANIQSSLYNSANLLKQNFPLAKLTDIATLMKGTLAHSQSRFDCIRLCDLFGLNAYAYIGDSGHSWPVFAPNVFPWQLLAYQTIWQYYYRLDDKSSFTNRDCNWDQYYSQSTAFAPTVGIFDIHQRPWNFDYFTSMYRSPIVSDANMQSIVLQSNYEQSDLISKVVGPLKDDGDNEPNVNSNNDIRGFGGFVGSSYSKIQIQAATSTANIRQMFAQEKLAMITGRARKTYDSQILAHFGVDVPHDPKHDIAFIGRDTYELKIGEVTSLSSTSSAGLGDLAGKGWTAGKSKGHKFVAPCHGVVMTIFSVEPRKRYYGGFDRINALTDAFDIPTPEYDRLGNMPMFRYETGERAGSGIVTDTDIIGWKERYYYNKRRHPKVTLAFMNNRSNLNLYNNRSAYMLSSAPFGAYTGTNNNTARPDLESRFYIDYNCMDGMMLQPYVGLWQNGLEGEEVGENWNESPWLAYSRDPFIIDLDMKIKKVSWMSKDGEPVYNF